MEIYIAADHNGFALKKTLSQWLQESGYQVIDSGPEQYIAYDDYPDYGIAAAKEIAEDTHNRRGILLCGSGAGMAVVANKVPGIRAALIHDPDIARAAQRDDDINVLTLGAMFITEDDAKAVINAWLETIFSGEERHVRRINKIKRFEQQNNAASSQPSASA